MQFRWRHPELLGNPDLLFLEPEDHESYRFVSRYPYQCARSHESIPSTGSVMLWRKVVDSDSLIGGSYLRSTVHFLIVPQLPLNAGLVDISEVKASESPAIPNNFSRLC